MASGSKVCVIRVVSLYSLTSIIFQTTPVTSVDETPTHLAGAPASQPLTSLVTSSVVVRSTPGSSTCAADLVATPMTLSMPTSNPVLVSASASVLPSDPASQELTTTRPDLPDLPADVRTAQDTSLATSTTAAVPGSSAGPLASDPIAARTWDTGDSQDTSGSASSSKISQTSAPVKPRKAATKEKPGPKKMADSK